MFKQNNLRLCLINKIAYSLQAAALGVSFYLLPVYAATTPFEISEEKAEELKSISTESDLKSFNQKREQFAQKYGTRFAFVGNYAQQVILRNKRDVGNSRALWYMNLDISQELWRDSLAIVEFETDKNKGVDKLIPTYSLFNSNSGENLTPYVPKLYLEQKLAKDKIFLAAGKLDLSDWFDCNEVANSADLQFMSAALVTSLTIPFPVKGIGGMMKLQPYEWFYFQAGAATAKSVATKTGLSNAFNGTLFISEFGFSPKLGELQGSYRFIPNLLHQKADRIMDDSENKRNQFGFSLSFDQEITKRITIFARYGFADHKLNDIAQAWSAGAQIVEPFPGRKYDCFALGVAQNILGRDAHEYYDPTVTAPRETMLETYYSLFLTDYLQITSDLQAVLEPWADKTTNNPIVATVRLLLSF